jgi:hypothetical protein
MNCLTLTRLSVVMRSVRVRTLARHERKPHQPARSIVDEGQQRARRATFFEPAVLTAGDLDQLAVMLAPQSWLMEGASLLARQPQALGNHPPAQGLSPNAQTVLFD